MRHAGSNCGSDTNPEKSCKGVIYAPKHRSIQLADPVTDLGARDVRRLVYHHLRALPQAGPLAWFHRDPQQWHVVQLASQRQHGDGRVLGIGIGLYDQRRPRLAVVA